MSYIISGGEGYDCGKGKEETGGGEDGHAGLDCEGRCSTGGMGEM